MMKKLFVLFSFILLMLSGCYQGSEYEPYYYPNTGYYYWGDNEQYNEIIENPFITVAQEAISTFAIDADGAAYANTRRFLNDGTIPPENAIRTEEFINYFNYDYPEPDGIHPISTDIEVVQCPWKSGNYLLRLGIKGKNILNNELPATNFVLLIDVSGSMGTYDKLELLKSSLGLFVDNMQANDRIAIVTYAGSSGIALESTSGANKDIIRHEIQSLQAQGSTAGADGIITAYEIAQQYYIEGGNNRIILATDGDFNVGISDQDELVELIKEKRETGIFLTVLGFGTGNLNEGMMEQLANNGNGNYEYIDSYQQAQKVFVHDFKNFHSIAKDVKIQITFNPELVNSYRLIGYENRALENDEFTDDEKDGGELGVDQTITALYELVPIETTSAMGNYCDMQIRYKLPNEDQSKEFSVSVANGSVPEFINASDNTRFAASLAAFAMVLFNSEYKGNATYLKILDWLEGADIPMEGNFEEELRTLIQRAYIIED